MSWFNTITEWLTLHHYGFSLNAYSLAFGGLILFTLAVVAKFSRNYLKGEVGEVRFWLLFLFFAMGILTSCFAENLKTFYVGWEMVGLASFFLIGFYQTNSRSIENSLIALSNYKICDLFFVMAILLEEANFYTGSGLCLIIATLAKSAQLPFSSWLYRALEGPTPSSTLFYGGLSLHLGAFVLLQFSPLWDHSGWLRLLVGSIGLASAIFGFLVGSVRSDLKTSFAFASISQVGLIYCEMAMGFYNLAMWHIIGHNLLRTWNYLRGMSFFDEFFREEYHQQNNWLLQKVFTSLPESFFFHSMNSFYLDRFSVFLRKWGLLVFAIGGTIGLAMSPEGDHYAFLGLGLALLVTVALFFKESLKPVNFLIGLVASQILFLASIHGFLEDKLEHLYLFVCLFSLGLLLFSLWPAVTLWIKQQDAGNEKQNFLGLATKLHWRHMVFLVAAILITGSPGTFEFFVQEGIIDEIWSRSHLFLVVAMVCLTLNTVHTFKIGQLAFLGEPNS
ncbi:MAG TPA: proton-conducting transporter membrane subunit [Pseudobdellovibrionaceae bacterium]|jgi:NADH:ubiquinone oxidoreductase subunit 5 (subunit L)/multisubunit Na+/H+ antiporter MnhA subunit